MYFDHTLILVVTSILRSRFIEKWFGTLKIECSSYER